MITYNAHKQISRQVNACSQRRCLGRGEKHAFSHNANHKKHNELSMYMCAHTHTHTHTHTCMHRCTTAESERVKTSTVREKCHESRPDRTNNFTESECSVLRSSYWLDE